MTCQKRELASSQMYLLLAGGGATAYNDGGLATGRAAQGSGAPGVSVPAFV